LRRLERYVFREVFSPALLGLAIYTFVMLMSAIFDVAELAIKKNLPASSVLKILALSLPQLLVVTIPMSVLLGILIGIGRLSADSEVVALRACGLSYSRVLFPVLGLGFVGWVVCGSLALWVEPETNYRRHQVAAKVILRSDLRKELKPKVVFEDIPGLLLYAEKVYRGGSSLEQVLLFQTDPQGRDLLTTARRGHLDYDSKSGKMRLLLEEGVTHRSDPRDAVDYQVYGADRQMVLREPDTGFKLRSKLLKEPQARNYYEQSLKELDESWQKAGSLGHAPTRDRLRAAIEVARQQRFAIPMACLVFSLIGFPLGVFNRRGGKSSGIAISLGVVLVYWLIWNTGVQLALEGRLSPVAALWLGNCVFGLAGAVLIRRRERQETGVGETGPIARVYAMGRSIRSRVAAKVLHRSRTAVPAPGLEPDGGPVPLSAFSGGPAFSTLLDRYVLAMYLRFLLFAGMSIYVIFMVVDFRELIDDVINNRVSGRLVLEFFKYRSPWVINQVLPVACLVATLLSFGVLTKFNEITAMKAGGLSLYRISVPVVGATVLLSLFSFGVQGFVLPFSNQKANQIRDQIKGRPGRSYTQPQRRWIQEKEGAFYSFRAYQRTAPGFLPLGGDGIFQGFSVLKLDPKSFAVQERIYAKEASWKEGSWLLRSGWERKFDPGGEIASFEEFAEKSIPLPVDPSRFMGDMKTPDQMNYSQLRDFIKDMARRGYAVQELQVDLYEKIAIPFISVVMVVLGLPFAFRAGNKGSLYGIGLGIGLVVFYYATFAVLSAMGQIGFLPPFLAAWAPNILFTGAGIWMMLTMVRT